MDKLRALRPKDLGDPNMRGILRVAMINQGNLGNQ